MTVTFASKARELGREFAISGGKRDALQLLLEDRRTQLPWQVAQYGPRQNVQLPEKWRAPAKRNFLELVVVQRKCLRINCAPEGIRTLTF